MSDVERSAPAVEANRSAGINDECVDDNTIHELWQVGAYCREKAVCERMLQRCIYGLRAPDPRSVFADIAGDIKLLEDMLADMEVPS